jgi:glycosyltransferase involved in cell wall biosynthesis
MRLLMSMFGWKDSGGGTIFPRQLALEFARRGHQVLVIYAAAQPLPAHPPYTVREQTDQGVQLVGIYNQPACWSNDYLARLEVSDPQVRAIFKNYIDHFQPDLIHYHNFFMLSMGFTDFSLIYGIPSFFTLHNFWLLCPTLYLYEQNRQLCEGINSDGTNCARCIPSALPGYIFRRRHEALRQKCHEELTGLWVSAPQIKTMLMQQGYAAEKIEVIKLGNLRAAELWAQLGHARRPFRGPKIRFGFMGALLPIKGIHVLVSAAQLLQGDFEIEVYGACEPEEVLLRPLLALDPQRRVSFRGAFEAEQQLDILSQLDVGIIPSSCHEQAGMAVEEFLAAGLPVIVSDRGGLPFYLQPGTGVVVPGDDPAALAAAMQALIDQPERVRDWQARIQPPVSFATYVNTLEKRYTQAITAHAPQRWIRRLEHFLQARRPEQMFYDIRTLQPLATFEPGCLLDLWTPAAVAACAPRCAQAAGVVSAAPLAVPLVTQALYLPPLWLPCWPTVSEPLPTDNPFRLLLLLTPEPGWQDWLKAVLAAYDSQSSVCLVLLPWRCTLTVEPLLDWLAAEGLDPEAGPELMLLDPDDYAGPEAVAGACDLLLSDAVQLSAAPEVLLRGPLLLRGQPDPRWPLCAAEAPDALAALLQYDPNIDVLQPDWAAMAAANQQLTVQLSDWLDDLN